MLTRKEFSEAINSPKTTEALKEEVKQYEDYIRRSKEYQPYISPLNEEIIHHYEREIEFLNSLKERKENQEEAMKHGLANLSVLSKKERVMEQNNQQIEKEKAIRLTREKRAGYTNASVLIFVVINLGLFLASLLLILK